MRGWANISSLNTRLSALLHLAEIDAQAIAACPPRRVAIVTCSYDTAFESIADQVDAKIQGLKQTLPSTEWSFWVTDDRPESEGFSAQVSVGFQRHQDIAHRLHVHRLHRSDVIDDDQKGRALLEAMGRALAADPALDALVYVNLNLKVPVIFIASGLRRVLNQTCGVAVGTRAPADGGVVIGAGPAGRAKSILYSRIARMALPLPSGLHDPNAPLKVFSAEAAQFLLARALIPRVTMDCEWVLIAHLSRWRITQFPIGWVQRPGSRPPWRVILSSLRDIALVRQYWRAGRYQPAAQP